MKPYIWEGSEVTTTDILCYRQRNRDNPGLRSDLVRCSGSEHRPCVASPDRRCSHLYLPPELQHAAHGTTAERFLFTWVLHIRFYLFSTLTDSEFGKLTWAETWKLQLLCLLQRLKYTFVVNNHKFWSKYIKTLSTLPFYSSIYLLLRFFCRFHWNCIN